MNNCPKCGNPLQVGTTSCPICGTNIANSVQPEPTTEGVKPTPTVAIVATPSPTPAAAPQPVSQPVQQEVQTSPAVAVQTVEPAPVTPPVAPVEQPAPEPKVEQPVAAPTTEPVAVQPAEVTTSPAEQSTQPVEATAPVDPNAIAPTIKTIEVGTPVPSIPASLNPETSIVTTTVDANIKTEKPKIKINKNVLVIVGILAIAVIACVLVMNMSKKPKLNTNTTPNAGKTSALELTSVSTNGYKFKLEDGWLTTEDGTNVIITNNEETVAIKLYYSKNSLDKVSKSTIEGYFASRTDFTNTEVTETTISAKKAYLVNTQINQAPVQLYYINGGTDLTIGAVTVYQSGETKTKYEANVTELIGSLSYSDESLKAISSMEMYSNIFGAYNGVFNYQPVVEQTPTEQTPVDQTPTEGTETNPPVEQQNQSTDPGTTPAA